MCLVLAAAALVLPGAAPLALPLLTPLLALAAPESRVHARAYLLLLTSVQASTLQAHLASGASPFVTDAQYGADSDLGLSSAFALMMLARLFGAIMQLLLAHAALQASLLVASDCF